MSYHNVLGKKGEELAKAYLQEKGFTVLHCNWRHSHYEIDVIATLKDTLHFVEVKSRSSNAFGEPEAGVSPKKMKQLIKAADAFLQQNPGWKWVQHDILAITIKPGTQPEYFFIQDVMYYG